MDFHGPSHTYRISNLISYLYPSIAPCLDCRLFVDILKYLLLNIFGLGSQKKVKCFDWKLSYATATTTTKTAITTKNIN